MSRFAGLFPAANAFQGRASDDRRFAFSERDRRRRLVANTITERTAFQRRKALIEKQKEEGAGGKIGTAVGAVGGFLVAGPPGAAVGATLGGSVGSAIDNSPNPGPGVGTSLGRISESFSEDAFRRPGRSINERSGVPD